MCLYVDSLTDRGITQLQAYILTPSSSGGKKAPQKPMKKGRSSRSGLGYVGTVVQWLGAVPSNIHRLSEARVKKIRSY